MNIKTDHSGQCLKITKKSLIWQHFTIISVLLILFPPFCWDWFSNTVFTVQFSFFQCYLQIIVQKRLLVWYSKARFMRGKAHLPSLVSVLPPWTWALLKNGDNGCCRLRSDPLLMSSNPKHNSVVLSYSLNEKHIWFELHRKALLGLRGVRVQCNLATIEALIL